VLRYFDDLSEAQIADVLQCSVGTVKSQLAKSRAKLEKVLGPALAGGGR
jgi:DNA-directed RNA polymerase specialized sigma24 family protein